VRRFFPAALVLGLLVATSAAFAVTESLKLTPSPITRTQVPLRAFSPLCNCDHAKASLRFSLRKADVLTLDVVTPGGREIRRVVTNLHAPRFWHTFSWNGRTNTGAVAPNGTYQFKVHLARARRTILLPNKVALDTTPPVPHGAEPNRRVFSPDGDHQSDSVRIAYRLSEPAHAALYLRGRRLVLVRFAHKVGSFTWDGRVGGVALPQGTYRLRVGAIDTAGNETPVAKRSPVTVRIRYIALRKHVLFVQAKRRFGIAVSTDAKTYTWTLGARQGVSNVRVLVVRAPATAGTYRLVVTEHGHRDSALVRVR
jgi:hypothetical protein